MSSYVASTWPAATTAIPSDRSLRRLALSSAMSARALETRACPGAGRSKRAPARVFRGRSAAGAVDARVQVVRGRAAAPVIVTIEPLLAAERVLASVARVVRVATLRKATRVARSASAGLDVLSARFRGWRGRTTARRECDQNQGAGERHGYPAGFMIRSTGAPFGPA
jgi:hypothetical protein